MTQDDVIRLAMQAWEEAGEGWVVKNWFEDRSNALEAFAKLVAEHEREACAKVSEAKGLVWKARHDINPNNAEKAYMASQFIASAIRARGQA